MLNWDHFFKATPIVMSLCSFIGLYIVSRRKDVDKRFKDVELRVDGVDHRLTTAEQTISTLPGKEDTHRLEMMLAEMGGDMKAMRATMRGMSESLTRTESIVVRHEDHLRGKNE
ncbi:MAG: DUF2730 family protein [Roseobacter sp.]